jgi:predicted nucleic acid-binding protein
MNGIEYLLDTNIIIGLLDGDDTCLHSTQDIDLTNSAITQITRIELLSFSLLSFEESQKIENFIATLHTFSLDKDIEQITIELRRKHAIKLPDAIIAATAITYDLELITLDKKLYKTWKAATLPQ